MKSSNPLQCDLKQCDLKDLAEQNASSSAHGDQDPKRLPISAFVICFNEEDHIGHCLDSLSFCDEVLVIDSFSKDRTVEIAKSKGAKVVQRVWPGYKEQKSYGLSLVENEWVLNLDADERVSDELREHILEILRREKLKDDHLHYNITNQDGKTSEDIAGYYINRVVYYWGRWWRQGGWYPEYRLRFFRKSKTIWGGKEPHERPEVSGNTGRLDGELYHYTYKNYAAQLERMDHFSTLAAREMYEQGRRANFFSIVVNPVIRTLKFFIVKRGFREGVAGLIVAITEGYYTFMKYAKLWEIEFNVKQANRDGQ